MYLLSILKLLHTTMTTFTDYLHYNTQSGYTATKLKAKRVCLKLFLDKDLAT